MPSPVFMNNDATPGFLDRQYTYSIRGLCMLAIVFGHTANEFPQWLAQMHLGGIGLCGRLATGVFLFLSGYGMTLSIGHNGISAAYVYRHLRNLLLPYLVFWLFYVAVGLCVSDASAVLPLCREFLLLKMPHADTWFFRVILAVYVLYFALAGSMGRRAPAAMCLLTVAYVAVAACCDVPSWWWNTVLCFPLGVLCAVCPRRLGMERWSVALVVSLALLFLLSHKALPAGWLQTSAPPVLFCLIVAQLSLKVRVRPSASPLQFIGRSSLYMYFMEAIPIDFIDSASVGFAVFVVGGIAATIVLTYVGKKVETRFLRLVA